MTAGSPTFIYYTMNLNTPPCRREYVLGAGHWKNDPVSNSAVQQQYYCCTFAGTLQCGEYEPFSRRGKDSCV